MAIIRFIALSTDPKPVSFILAIVYLFVAVILLLVEIRIKKSQELFLFLNFYHGKGAVFFMLAFTMLSSDLRMWLQYPIAVFFFLIGTIYFIEGWAFREQEETRVKREVLEPMAKETRSN